jgi:chromatin segregation and condensation protein Rec8/ScpA/Scc1 (kleisin family)
MTKRLLVRLGRGHASFDVLVGADASRTERIVGFMAVLTLLRQRVIDASQHDLFTEISISRVRAVGSADD